MRSSKAYDLTDISSSSGVGPMPLDTEAQEVALSEVPSQSTYRSRTSSLSQRDRELRSFPLAMASRFFFFVACAMFLWLSIDDLYWADEARTIPQTVLQADDDTTWRQFRMQQAQTPRASSTSEDTESIGNNGYTRPSSAGSDNDADEEELSWSELKDIYGGNEGERFLRASSKNLEGENHRRQQASFQTPWSELSFSKQISAAVLGYNANSWNNGQPVFTDTLSWNSLTTEQREAAVNLGYDQYLWDLLRGFGQGTSVPNSNPATNPPEPVNPSTQVNPSNQANPSNQVNPANQDWGVYFWNELPAEIRQYASKLGYDEYAWNNGERTYADDLFWDELTPEQQEAALALGYTEDKWNVYTDSSASSKGPSATSISTNNRNPSTSAPAPTTTTSATTDQSNVENARAPNVNWRAYDWGDLPPEIKSSAIAMGYTEELWQSGAGVSTDRYFWDELSDEQQSAANILFGYTETTWNAANNKWQKVKWNNLPSDIRASAEILGYNSMSWEAGAEIDTQSYSWEELSGEQQQAVYEVFGLNEQSWVGAALKEEEENVKNKGGGRGGGRGGADDDYVFNVGDEESNKDVWISKYQIVYFVASFCFVAVGILDLIREKRSFHTLMIFAGIFGILASLWVESSLATSNIFHCFSMHFLLFQGAAALFYRKHWRALLPGPGKNALWVADVGFFIGALMESILSYFYFKDDARENLRIARVDSFAALLFLLTAVIYIALTPVAFIRNTRNKPYM